MTSPSLFEVIPWNGEQITKPGIYSGVPLVQYHHNPALFDGPSISSSGLRTIFHKSPRHFWDVSSMNPDAAPDDPTEAMILGRAVHMMFAQESGFHQQFAIRPDTYTDSKTGAEKPWSGNATVCKEWLAAQKAEGREVLTSAMVERIKGMVKAVSESDEGAALSGMAELTIAYRDEATGIWVKSRPDEILSGDIIDFKAMGDITDYAIRRAIGDGLNQQAALSAEAFEQVTGSKPSAVALCIVESDRPHCVRLDSFTDDDLATGASQNRIAIDLFAYCLKSGRWPGPENKNGAGGSIGMSPFKRSELDDKVTHLRALLDSYQPAYQEAAE